MKRGGSARPLLLSWLVIGTGWAALAHAQGVLVSDDFNTCQLNESVWTRVDPVGGGSISVTGVGTENALLQINVPAGPSHDVWSDGNRAVRAVQAAANTDFEIQAKFESAPAVAHQTQGLLVEQDANTCLRFDTLCDGAHTILFCATISNGSAVIRKQQTIARAVPFWFSIKRAGDHWTMRYSTNGSTWTNYTTFPFVMTVARVGPFAGNYSPGVAPAYTATVDYFLNTAAPFIQEDGPPAGPGAALTHSVVGQGTIEATPAAATYYCGETVTLNAVPAAGWAFQSWSGDLIGSEPQKTIVMDVPHTVQATFVPDGMPPTISDILVDAGMATATVKWKTAVPADSRVAYGRTSGYELGTVTNSALVTDHVITLTNLTPDTEYHYKITSVDDASDLAETADLSFVTSRNLTGIESDDFNGCGLGSGLWTLIDPVGGGSVATAGMGTADARLEISVPGGTSHDIWTDGNHGVRVLQNATNSDLELIAKFDSMPTSRYQMQGFVIEQDNNVFMRYDAMHDGWHVSLFSAGIAGANAKVFGQNQISSTAPLWLSVKRRGNDWTLAYSYNGQSFTTHAAFNFPMVVNRVGLWGGNYSTNGAPAYTVLVDSFINVDYPSRVEDGPISTPGTTLTTNTNGRGAIKVTPPLSEIYYCNEQVTVEAIAEAGWTFSGWSGDLLGSQNPQTITMDRSYAINATFIADQQPPAITAVQISPSMDSAIIQWQTDTPSNSAVLYGYTTDYELGAVQQAEFVTQHSITLSGLEPDLQYHVKLRSVDSGGDPAETGDLVFNTTGDPTGMVTDDFNKCTLNTAVWSLVDPVGGANVVLTGVSTVDALAEIHVPGGASHDVWAEVNDAVRIMQRSRNVDFEVQAKFETLPNQTYQFEGLMVEESASQYMRYDLLYDYGRTSLFAVTFSNTSALIRANQSVSIQAPFWLGVRRVGNQWTLLYSQNGSSWNTLASFSHVMNVARVGPYAGNYSEAAAPAFTAKLDYFLNTAAPFADEDGPLPSNPASLVTSVVGEGAIAINPPERTLFYCNETVTLTAVPTHGWRFVSWGGDLTGTTNPQQLQMTDPRNVQATFEFDPSILVSDDFNQCTLNTALWQVVDPLGGASLVTKGAGSNNAGLRISVPGGVPHDITVAGINAPRVMQPANDTDMAVAVRFDTPALLPEQLEGIIVQQDPTTLLKFAFRNAANQVQAVAAVIAGATEAVKSTVTLPAGSPRYMRVRREGNTWFHDYSFDGASWTNAGSFEQAIVVSSAGVFAGNTGTAPAFTSVVDYFFNTASVISPEDGPPIGNPGVTLATSVVGEGSIVADPSQTTFYCGDTITVRAEPALGWRFVEWTGDVTGSEPVQTLVMSQARSVEATFVIDDRPIQFSDIAAKVTDIGAVITWKTNKPTKGAIGYGATTAYEIGEVFESGFATEHSLGITGLSPATLYHFVISCHDVWHSNYTNTTPDQTFRTSYPGGFGSDDFNTYNLDASKWTIVDPLQDAAFYISGTNTPNARVYISIPANVPHGFTTTAMNAPRLMQPAWDTDLGLEAKFESILNRRFQMNGLLVEESASKYLRADFYSNGTGTFLYIATFSAGVFTEIKNQPVITNAVNYLRVTRTGQQWKIDYSYNGATWNTGAVFVFPMVVTHVGPYAATDGTPSPAFTAAIDYVFNASVPIVPEDGSTTVTDTLAPNIFSVRASVQEIMVDVFWSTDEPASSILEYGETLSYEAGSVSDASLVTAHQLTVMNLKAETPYHFRVTSQDAAGNLSRSADVLVTTGKVNYGPKINVWYGPTQEFGKVGTPQPMINVLGNVADEDGVVSLTYSLNDGPAFPLNVGPDTRRLAKAGDFNIDLLFEQLLPGANKLVLEALDGIGRQSRTTLSLVNSKGPVWPLPYTADWSTTTSVNGIAQVVDGNWVIEGATIRPLDIAYDRLVAIGDLTWQDYELTVPITVRSIDPAGYNAPSFGPGVGMVFRWPGHSNDGHQPIEGVYPLGAIGMFRWTDTYERYQIFGNNGATLAAAPGSLTLDYGLTYNFKMRVQTIPTGARYSLKVWESTQPFEPYDWTIVGDQLAINDPGRGSVLLLAHHVDASFGKVVCKPAPFDDGPAPEVANLQISALDHSISLNWDTNYPTRSIVSYGTTTAYEGGDLVDPNFVTSHTMQITALQPSTEYHIRIAAVRENGIGVYSDDTTIATTFGCEVDSDSDGTVDCLDGCPADPNKTTPGACGCGVAETDCNLIPNPPAGWVDTDANNSLAVNDSLFGMFTVGGTQVFGTTSTASNIHSHYVGANCYDWANFEFSGAMMVTNPNGGIGITVMSDFPNSDTYYRLRRYSTAGYQSFHVSPHPNGVVTMSGGQTNSGIVPQANVWYRFRMRAEDLGTQTQIRAKIWPEAAAEPANWQIDCVDAHANRIIQGTVGVWTMGPGAKYWKDLSVRILPEAPATVIPMYKMPAKQYLDRPEW